MLIVREGRSKQASKAGGKEGSTYPQMAERRLEQQEESSRLNMVGYEDSMPWQHLLTTTG